ncbi:MAG: hypothetical protein K8S16_19445, partial [Bacteroidales bacterium]|nr:hypothetical protein [Bacteroidales bacterium]
TGKPVYFAYTDAQSGLNLSRPRFAWVLFGYRKGWLLYSPLMILSVLGFIGLYNKQRKIFYAVFIFFFLNLYLIASFSTLVSYGFRAFIQSYAVLIIPFGYSIQYLFSQKKWLIIPGSILLLAIFYLNIFQSWQFRAGILHGQRNTKAYYWKVFLKKSFEPEDRELLLVRRFHDGVDKFQEEEKFTKRTLYYNSFEAPSNWQWKKYRYSPVSAGSYSFLLDSTIQYLAGLEKKYSDITDNYYSWFRVSLDVFPFSAPEECDVRLVIGITYKGDIYKYRSVSIADEIYNAKANQWTTISLDYLTPEIRTRNDYLNVYIWHRGKKEACIDAFRVDAFTVD